MRLPAAIGRLKLKLACGRKPPAVESCLIPKKVELLIRFFEPFGRSRVFNFGKVEHLPGPLGASDETYTLSKIDISGSNETMQNALASIVQVWRIFEIFFFVSRISKNSVFWVKFVMGVKLGKEHHKMNFKGLRPVFDQPN